MLPYVERSSSPRRCGHLPVTSGSSSDGLFYTEFWFFIWWNWSTRQSGSHVSKHIVFFFKFLFYIGVELVNNVLVSGRQERDSAIQYKHSFVVIKCLSLWKRLFANPLASCFGSNWYLSCLLYPRRNIPSLCRKLFYFNDPLFKLFLERKEMNWPQVNEHTLGLCRSIFLIVTVKLCCKTVFVLLYAVC